MLIEEMLKEERDAGHKEGLIEGRNEGRNEGEALFAELTNSLLAAGRVDDLKKAANDRRFRQELFKEFGIK